MQIVLFQLGKERFAIECRHVLAIVPMVTFKPFLQAPVSVAGMFDYRGTIVPVIDLCQLTTHRPCNTHFSSRIILIDYTHSAQSSAPSKKHVLGLLAEHVTEIREKPQASPAPVRLPDAPYLGEILSCDGQMVQCVDPRELLPESLRKMLFAETAEAGAR